MENLEKLDLYQNTINELRPFEGEMLKQIKDFYRIGLTWTSNALEGNSLTESETKVLIEDGLTVGGRPLRDMFETVDHAKAYDYMFTLLGNKEIVEKDIIYLHKLFYQNIEEEFAGRYRDIPVFISGSNHPVSKVEDIQSEIDELCKWIKTERKKYHPVEFAAILHKKFVFIHPFKDGNGRVARLLMNTALIQDGYLPALIPPILRSEYISLLEKAHEDDGPFINFIIERELESQKDFLRLLHIPLPKLEQDNGEMKME
ncbi:Fic/DOC family protein [Tissierella praeacuta DSM 18095]|uniref:Fic/DOC family protein n=1 Tax=Tissierella praeacuta DSM 18095 TaxID=1123404 RepID=A0A1M4UUY5_9FIRM|nr:Fic family protein [Tissierella praeacuta]SHE60495.1 Fic/DOC family protein [Tissierella praeacuta DSM 18095]SUP02615.1 Protein involved in cell division [Tissierella praeacuta]